jgi:hypothetical protein
VVAPEGPGDPAHGGHGQAQAPLPDDAKARHAGQLTGARLRVQQGQGGGQTVGQGWQIDGVAGIVVVRLGVGKPGSTEYSLAAAYFVAAFPSVGGAVA